MFAEEKDVEQREQERLLRSLNRVNQQPPKITKPSATTTTTTSATSNAPPQEKSNWRQQEEERKAREEQRRQEIANQRKENLDQIGSTCARETAAQEDDFLQKAWSSTTEEERLKREEDMIQKRMFRATPGRTGPTPEEVEEHNRKIQQKEEQQKHALEEEKEREHNRALALEKQFPRFEVDGKQLLDVISELNKVRVSPKLYAKYLQELLDQDRFSGTIFKIPDSNQTRETSEGEEGIKKAIEFLKTAPRLKMFNHSDGLSLSCYDLIRNHNPLGATGAIMNDGTTAEKRVETYGKISSPWEELMIYKFATPSDIVLQWIVDDGDLSRRRRNIILNEKYTTIGICLGPNSKHTNECVVTFCAKFDENPKN